MCKGNIACKACSSKIGKMATRTKIVNKNTLTTIGAAVVGYLGARYVSSKVKFINGNPMIGGIAKVAGGLFLTGMSNGIAKGVGLGMTVDGGSQLIGTFIPKLDTSLAINVPKLGTVDLNRVHRVAGIRQGQYTSEAAMTE